MPCPLRVVLVAVSAVLLLCAASAPVAPLQPEEAEEEKRGRESFWASLRERLLRYLSLAWQLASGRVILERLKAARGGGNKAKAA